MTRPRVGVSLQAWMIVAALAWGAPLPGAAAAPPEDWGQWGGPLRNGTSTESGLFGAGLVRLKEVWRRPIDEGIAGIVVAGDRLVTLASAAGQDHVLAVDAATGKELWRVPLGASPPKLEFGAASTPATDGRRVFVLSPGCRLLALQAADGKPVWERDLKQLDNTGPIPSGCFSSPLLEGDLLVVQANGEPDKRVMAFEAATGAIRWSSPGTARAVRTSPLGTDLAGVRQVVVHETLEGKGGLYGLRLTDGALLWSVRFPDGESFAFDTPLPLPGDRLAVITWSDLRAVQVRAKDGTWSAEPLWRSRDVRAETQPFTFHAVFTGGHLYGIGGDTLSCLDPATGQALWKEKTYAGSLAAVDGHLLLLSQAAGVLRVIEASPAGYKEKGRREVFNPGALSDTPPTLAGRRIYLRNMEEMVALEIEK
jgi:outer membrane protein assembly factor BamB